MARLVLALVSGAVASEDVAMADFDDALSLLQLSAKRSQDLDHLDDMELSSYGDDLHDSDQLDQPGTSGWPTWPMQPKPAFGPDGTWATPYCKDIRGCTPYCVPGCDGAARWVPFTFANARLGIRGAAAGSRPMDQRHFAACDRGKDLAPTPVGSIRGGPNGGWLNCKGSENSTKAPLWPEASGAFTGDNPVRGTGRWANLKMPTLNRVEARYDMTAYGYEYCPIQCVNDCAYFKYGNFHQCGATVAGWAGYNLGNSPSVGSNKRCNVDHVTYGGAVSAYLWCGEPTTTTTTTPPPPPLPVAEPVDEGDNAEAVGDPHVRTNANSHFDLKVGSD